jgi:hypothetical protein
MSFNKIVKSVLIGTVTKEAQSVLALVSTEKSELWLADMIHLERTPFLAAVGSWAFQIGEEWQRCLSKTHVALPSTWNQEAAWKRVMHIPSVASFWMAESPSPRDAFMRAGRVYI